MKLGNIATGSDFWGREQVLHDLWSYLEKDNLQFPGVRRLGKTSVLRRLQEQAADHGVYAVHRDLSDVHNVQQFVEKLDRAFPQDALQAFFKQRVRDAQRWLDKLESIKIPALVEATFKNESLSWVKHAQDMQARLQKQPLLILLDEFPIMLQNLLVKNPQEGEQLLAWLRVWRQQKDNTCRFLFTGSMGLQALLEQHSLAPFMNDCFVYTLGPFQFGEAAAMWRHFSAQKEWHSPDPVGQYALQRIGWLSPYYVCLMLDASIRAACERVTEIPPKHSDTARVLCQEDVESAYQNLLARRSFFQHWEKRLQDRLEPPTFQFCQKLLTCLSRADSGLSLRQLNSRLSKLQADVEQREQQIQTLLPLLTDEGYITPVGDHGRVQFASFLLRDWWKRNHV